LSISHAAAALAIVLIGYKTGIIDENILNGTIILILITCIIGSVLTERAALKITMDEEHLATLNSGRVSTERILLPVAAFQNMDAYISLASLLTDHSPAFTITLLTVVENNPDTDKNIEISRRWHEKAHRDALSNEVYLDSMITIDVNIVSGILRVSREMPASTILLGWPGKPHFFEKLFGLKTDSIINTSNKKIMVYRPVKPVNIHSKTFLVSPPYSELEPGFPDILYLIDHLTGVSKTKIIYLGTERTVNFIREYHKLNKHKNSPEFRIIPGGEDINIYAEIFREDDLLVFVGSKRGSVSYNEGMESMPSRLGKKFPFNSILLVYPGTSRRTGRFEDYSDPDSRPLKKSIGRVGRWFIEKGKRSG